MCHLGVLLKKLRGKESLRSVAERAGISHTYLSILEKGKDLRSGSAVKPTPETLRILSKAYSYSYEELMRIAGYVDKEFEEHLDKLKNFDPFLIFQLIKTKTDDEIINEYRHQAEGKDIDEETVRAHLNFVRYLEAQKNQKK